MVGLLLIRRVRGPQRAVTFAARFRVASISADSKLPNSVKPPATAEAAEHGMSQKAVEIGSCLRFPITNSMVVSWMVALGLIIFARFATRRMDQVPSGAQNFLEWLVESLYGFLEGLLGKHLVDRTFWYFATVFIFILSANWIGLLPGRARLGGGTQTPHGFKIDQPWAPWRQCRCQPDVGDGVDLLRLLDRLGPARNWTLGISKRTVRAQGESAGGFLKIVLVVVFFVVGCLEVVSILFRPVSLSFRLYGNTFAGENMLETNANLVPGLGWLLPVPFYFLELLVGLVQALVFMLLTAVFTLLICQHEEGAKPQHA